MKIAICRNAAFSFSDEAHVALREAGVQGAIDHPRVGESWPDGGGIRESYGDHVESSYIDCERHDPRVIAVIERLGVKANGAHSDLAVIEIPDGVEWEIKNNDHREWVAERHRTWG